MSALLETMPGEPQAVERGQLPALMEAVEKIASLEAALAERDILVRELEHRLKNNLASMRGIAQQTLRSAPSPQAFVEAMSGRLSALARAQDLVTAARGEPILLEAVLHEGVGETDDGRMSLQGPPVRLAAESAANLVMAVHELASNALRHGALSAPDGRVEVVWDLLQGRLELDWRERGGPPAHPPHRRGFGLKLAETGLPRSLGGVAEVEFHARGLSYRLSAPLSAAIRIGAAD